MKSRAELWETYKPKLDEARTRDRVEQSALFIPVTARVGRFDLEPMTIGRLLALEALQSPFVTGGKVPTRRDVLIFLFVMSPGFTLSRWRMRWWMVRHCFIIWPWYMMRCGELLEEAQAFMGDDKSVSDGDAGSAWAAMIIDGLSSQYSWSLKEILDTPLPTVFLLGKAMGARMSMDKNPPSPSMSRHADKVRGDYLEQCKSIDRRERTSDVKI